MLSYDGSDIAPCNKINKQLMRRSRGGDRGSGPPLKVLKIIGLLSNTGQDPLKNHKATKPAFNVGPSSGHQRNAV